MRSLQEDRIKMALEMQCDAISASEALKQKIDGEIGRQGEATVLCLPEGKTEVSMKNEMYRRKHFNSRKFLIGVAAACLLLSGSVFAGKTAGYISGRQMGKYTYEERGKAEAKLGYEVDLVKDFDNGYSFQSMAVQETRAVDQNNKTLYTFPELTVDYGRSGVFDISLFVEQGPETGEQEKVPDLTDMCGEITLRYDVYTYKLVPENYVLTAEDRANMARDDYEISEGADKVEYSRVSQVTWVKDGVHYDLLGMDTALSGEEMLGMAKEIINEG